MLVSETLYLSLMILMNRLNPCFSGCWFLSANRNTFHAWGRVLILVLVDVGFWETKKWGFQFIGIVLILVLVDVGFWDNILYQHLSNWGVLILVLVDVGFWGFGAIWQRKNWNVLILVLVDVGFWEYYDHIHYRNKRSLNPCFSGCWFLRVGRRLQT